jgi:hypothetical protein
MSLQRIGERIAYFGPVFRWLFFPTTPSPSVQVFTQTAGGLKNQESLAFIEYTGVPAMFGGSVIPVASQAAYQGGQAKFITQPAAAKMGVPLSFRGAFAAEFILGTLAMALVLTIVDPKDHRTGGLAERTWYKDNIEGWWSLPSSGGYWNTDNLREYG